MSSEICEQCLQYLHYTKYLQSKIRVLERKLKQIHTQPESDTSSDDSSESSSDEDLSNHGKRRVIEVQNPSREDKKKIEINKVKTLAKKKKKEILLK
jgi:hypothetical protein